MSYPGRLALQVEYLRTHPEVDLVGGGVLVFWDEANVIGSRRPAEEHAAICRAPFRGFPIAHPTYCGRLAWFKQYRYDKEAVRCEDQDMLLRSYPTGRFGNIPQIVLGYREQVALPKLLASRRHFSRRILKVYVERGRPLLGLWGCFEQALKGMVDIASALGGRVGVRVRRRAAPPTAAELARWQQVLESVNGPRSAGLVKGIANFSK